MVEVALGDEVPQLEAVALADGVVDDDELLCRTAINALKSKFPTYLSKSY